MVHDFYSDFEGFDVMDEQYPFQEDVEENYDGTFGELLQHCIIPTLYETYPNLLSLFIVCLLFRFLVYFSHLYKAIFPLSSIICGLYLLYMFFSSKVIHVITLTLSGYFLLKIIPQSWKIYKGYFIGVSLILYLLVGEFVIVKYDGWTAIRGTQMIAAMKILSFSFDTTSGVIKEMNVLNFFGYVLCPSNCIFGPWVPYTEYKNLKYNDNFNLNWLKKILRSLVLSVLFFIASVCYLEWFIADDYPVIWIYYRNALLYRVGHYFVSYISEVSCLISGFGGKNSEFSVTKPLTVELPFSLVQVVVNWNLPIHKWLKTYVFKTTLPLGSFVAVMVTYLVSALLHGFNVRLAAVLLSLGAYTYVEHSLRNCLSEHFNACIASKPCPTNCTKHRRTTKNLIVHMINALFMLSSIFHLTYLGILINVDGMKTSTGNHFKEWSNLKFVSHWIVLATFCVYLLMRLFI